MAFRGGCTWKRSGEHETAIRADRSHASEAISGQTYSRFLGASE